MSKFEKIKGFSNYEISDDLKFVRNKNKQFVSADKKSGSIRLVNDEGQRITINKKDFATKLVPVTSEVEPEVSSPDDTAATEPTPVDTTEKSTDAEKQTEPVASEEPAKKTKLIKKALKKPETKPKLKKPAGTKRASNTVSNGMVRKGEKVEITAAIQKVLEGDGSKSSKMEKLYGITKSVTKTAMLLKTHYSYVYNQVIWYPKNGKAKKGKK